MSEDQDLKSFLDAVWQDYLKLNPLPRKVLKLLEDKGEVVFNDHIALRTFNEPKINLKKLAQSLERFGYIQKDHYAFKQKKLQAYHYVHPNDDMPKVFISELEVEKLSEKSQEIIQGLMTKVSDDYAHRNDFIYSGRPWELTHDQYLNLLKESEYAAWMAAFGFRPNHFTVSVNKLKSVQDIDELTMFLQGEGVEFNTSGGLIKGTKDVGLRQSSTLANKVNVTFADKSALIPSCYYEFAERYPVANGELYQGFVTASADKIFESTDVSQS